MSVHACSEQTHIAPEKFCEHEWDRDPLDHKVDSAVHIRLGSFSSHNSYVPSDSVKFWRVGLATEGIGLSPCTGSTKSQPSATHFSTPEELRILQAKIETYFASFRTALPISYEELNSLISMGDDLSKTFEDSLLGIDEKKPSYFFAAKHTLIEVVNILGALSKVWKKQREQPGVTPIDGISLPKELIELAIQRIEGKSCSDVKESSALLGKGTFGSVYAVKDREDIVIKDITPKPHLCQDTVYHEALHEMAIALLLGESWHAPALYVEKGSFGNTCIVMKKATGIALPHSTIGSLKQIHDLLHFFPTLISMEKHGIIHGDIKWQNILGYTLLDAGSMHLATEKRREGTILYFSPELLKDPKSSNTHKSDMWAFGASLFEAYTGKNILYEIVDKFGHTRTFFGIEQAAKELFENPEMLKTIIDDQAILTPAGKNFFKYLLQAHHSAIPTATELQDSPQFRALVIEAVTGVD